MANEQESAEFLETTVLTLASKQHVWSSHKVLGGHVLNNSKFDCKNRVLSCSLALRGHGIVMDLFFIEAEKKCDRPQSVSTQFMFHAVKFFTRCFMFLAQMYTNCVVLTVSAAWL